ncbi:putative phage tail protein, partial [Paenibacillus vini]|uniref:putative phage tail protein n=1 Tax=Paenibacillus vini TaxID=1476024 RepID=UPI001BCE32A9
MIDVRREMAELVPDIYDGVFEIQEIQRTIAEEFEKLMAAQDDVHSQSRIITATWNLGRWERIFGLPINPRGYLTWSAVEDSGLTLGDLEVYTWETLEKAEFLRRPYSERRAIILAKLRGSETTTEKVLRDLIRSFTGLDVDIAVDYPHYTVTFTFLDNIGVPKSFADAKRAVGEVIPAHLAYEF